MSVATGETIGTEMADNFTGGLEELLSHNCATQRVWKARLNEEFKPVNTATRRGGFHERNDRVMLGNFSAAESFLRECKDSEGVLRKAAQRLVVSVQYAATNLFETEVQQPKIARSH